MARMYIYRNLLREIVTILINKDTRKLYILLYILLNLNVERNKKFKKERNFYKVIIFNHLNQSIRIIIIFNEKED